MPYSNARPLAAAALSLALLSGHGASAQDVFDPATMSDSQREAFGEAVRDYLMSNPQVIMEAVSVLEQREADMQVQADEALVSNNAEAIFDDGYSWVGGNPDGDITVVEFMDYRCGYCRRASPEVAQLIETDGDIRLIVKEFPILGEASMISSQFAIATQIVAGDEAYKAVHDALMALEGEPNDAVLSRLADTLGLDADAIMAEMDSDEVTRRIAETRALAQQLQINGTPTFVFGDQLIRGYAPLNAMQQIVAQERAEG
ncbi:DsbA family protein [Citreimonas salinaria]|uniref:Protein-disulfide isomerase n=1 Tax=Citreimonas salinaria TaxID=321339 RepID=A0A1H3GDP1_9RHOB|nr:DsbA family protein [Citreimonas salinaria]SDY01155.1 Protein-disulfide isomerase [Citreimonas salinaria]